MKINEVLQPSKINEASTFLSLLLGKDIADQYDTEDRHAEGERIFLDDFIRDATVSLRNGIKAGLIDPDKKSPNPGASVQKTPSDDSTAPESGSPGPTSTPTTPTAPKSGSPAPSLYDRAVDLVIRDGMPNGIHIQRQLQISFDRAMSLLDQMEQEGIVSAADFDGRRKILAPKPVKESRYHKMNRIFESIMETEDEVVDEGPQSITDYMTEWFKLYMQGVNYTSKKTIVDAAIKKVEDTYKNDFGKAALEKLGRLAFALSGPAKQLPAGARDINPAASSAFSAASGRKLLTPDQLAGQLAALTPTERAEVLKKVSQA